MLRNLLFNARMSFRMWVRNRTRPLTVEEAEEKKLFWAKVYVVCGAITFLFVTASTLLNSNASEFSKSLPIDRRIIESMNKDDKIRVIKYSGFSKVSDALMTKEDAYEIRDSEKGAASMNNSKEIK